MNFNDSFQVPIYNTGAATCNFTVAWYQWDNDGGQKLLSTSTQSIVSTAAYTFGYTWTQVVGAYVTCSVTASVNTTMAISDVAGTLRSSISGAASVMCHRTIKDYVNNVASCQKARVLGASLMYSNFAPLLNKQGAIYSVQLTNETCWKDLIGDATAVSSYRLSDMRQINNGAYGFLKPGSQMDFSERCNVSVNEFTIVDSYWPLKLGPDNSGSYLLMYAIVDQAVSRNAIWTYSNSVEFQTTNQWFQVAVSRMDPLVCTEVLAKIKDMPQFHENPTHIRDIYNSIRGVLGKGARGVAKYTPKIMRGLERYGPSIIKAAEMLG